MNGGVSHFPENNRKKLETADGKKEKTKRKEMEGECGVIWKVVAARPRG